MSSVHPGIWEIVPCTPLQLIMASFTISTLTPYMILIKIGGLRHQHTEIVHLVRDRASSSWDGGLLLKLFSLLTVIRGSFSVGIIRTN